MIRIDGRRIYLRDHIYSDLEIMHKMLSDKDTMKYLPGMRTQSREETLIKLAETISESLCPDRTKYYFAVVLKGGEIMGDAGFSVRNRHDNSGIANIGYFLFKEYWGKGYATETAELMIEYCFNELGLHKVVAGCDSENKASEKVMIRCGMKKEAEFKKHIYMDGGWRDRYEYALLKDDYNREVKDDI